MHGDAPHTFKRGDLVKVHLPRYLEYEETKDSASSFPLNEDSFIAVVSVVADDEENETNAVYLVEGVDGVLSMVRLY